MAPPANYPDFEALASEVGGALHPKAPGEAIDRYLGRLAGSGVTVHQQVRAILSSPDSKPNAIHTAIVGISGIQSHFHANQITQWKVQLLEGASGVFGEPRQEAAAAVDVKALHAKIGQLTLENDFLESALTKAGLLSAKR